MMKPILHAFQKRPSAARKVAFWLTMLLAFDIGLESQDVHILAGLKTDALTVTGAATVGGTLVVTGATTVGQFVNTIETIATSGSNNNVALGTTTTIIRVTLTGNTTWTGLTGGGSGRVVILYNVS